MLVLVALPSARHTQLTLPPLPQKRPPGGGVMQLQSPLVNPPRALRRSLSSRRPAVVTACASTASRMTSSPIWLISRSTRSRLTRIVGERGRTAAALPAVLLASEKKTGDGGDELFGGYPWRQVREWGPLPVQEVATTP